MSKNAQLTRRSFAALMGAAALAGTTNPLAVLAAGPYTPGTYVGSGKGMGGKLEVTVTFSSDAILSVEVGDNAETPGIGTKAIEQLPALIVEANGTDGIDGVSGASITSQAIIKAVDECVKQATGEGTEEAGAVRFVPGTYATTTYGALGEFDVTATFSETTLESIEAGENSETLMVGSSALDLISSRIVEFQTLDVDSIAGASLSSFAMLSAAENLVEQAGGSVEAFSANKAVIPTYQGAPHEADILIVGGGLAGCCAAVSAAQNGASVILIEALQFTAGNTCLSTGSHMLGGGTPVQQGLGIEQTPEEFYQYIDESSDGMKDPNVIRMIVDYSMPLIDWYADLGIRFADTLTGGKTGNHNITPNIGTAIKILRDKAIELGVAIHYATKANDLLLDQNGGVTGVKATDYYGNEVEYTAKRTILACGGYGDNPDLLAQTWGEEYRGLVYGGLKGMDGAMMLAAMDAGADTFGTDWPHVDACLEVTKGITITTNLLKVAGGIIVRTDGKRFADEVANHSEVASATMHELGDPYFYEIYPSQAREVSEAVAHKCDVYEKMQLPVVYDSLEEMAAQTGVDLENLKATIEAYNAAVRGEQADEFGRTQFYVELKAPFYTIKVSNGVACTAGGLKVDENHQVLRTDGSLMENLFAIGEIAGGALLGYIGGESLSNASIGGMVLGAALAQELAE